MEKTTYQTKQELVNAICREYADFLDFNIQTMTFDEWAYDTIYKKGGKICNAINWLNDTDMSGKSLFICTEMTTHIMPLQDFLDNRNADPDEAYGANDAEYLALRINRIITGEADDAPDGKFLCYLIDYDTNTAEKIDGSILISDSAENLVA